MEKLCSKCGETKSLDCFNKNKARKDGVSVYCKICTKNYSKSDYWKEYERNRQQKRKSTDSYVEYQKKYREMNMDKFVENNKIKYNTNPVYKLSVNFRNRLRVYIKRKSVPSKSILGCDWTTFKKYIESKFIENMSWENHGQFGWHLDHIIPLASAKNEEELIKLNHYTNLQPLWWRDNLSKRAKVIDQD